MTRHASVNVCVRCGRIMKENEYRTHDRRCLNCADNGRVV